MSEPRVYNYRWQSVPEDAVYVGRPGPFGNPFILGRDGTRDEVISLFKNYLRNKPVLIKRVQEELKGKSLVCWCFPEPCHADILLKCAAGVEW